MIEIVFDHFWIALHIIVIAIAIIGFSMRERDISILMRIGSIITLIFFAIVDIAYFFATQVRFI